MMRRRYVINKEASAERLKMIFVSNFSAFSHRQICVYFLPFAIQLEKMIRH